MSEWSYSINYLFDNTLPQVVGYYPLSFAGNWPQGPQANFTERTGHIFCTSLEYIAMEEGQTFSLGCVCVRSQFGKLGLEQFD